MGAYTMIKKEFAFLSEFYGFTISMKQKRGSYYYIVWTNSIVDIMVLYADCVDEHVDNPIRIRINDSRLQKTIVDAIEYQNEFALQSGTPGERIHCAAMWLKSAIADRTILI